MVPSVNNVAMGARAATAQFASAWVGRLSTRRFSSVEKLPPGMEVNGPNTLPLAAADVGVTHSSRVLDQRRSRLAARRVAVDLGLEPGSRSATFPMREAPEGSLGDGASATLGRPSTRSCSELRQANLPVAAGANELAERSSEEDDLELWRAEHPGDLRRRFLDPSLVFPEGPIAAGSGNGGP